MSYYDEVSEEEADRIMDAHCAPGGPIPFLVGFVNAQCEGRFDDARSCLDPDYSAGDPDAIGDPLANGLSFIVTDEWGWLGTPECLDNGDEVVTAMNVPAGYVQAGTPMSPGVRFTVRHRDGLWSIVRIVRYGC